MSHFAKVIDNYQVVAVIVAEQDYIDSLPPEPGVRWIQTSYNTQAGQHKLGGVPLRKNYAAPGFTYREDLDAFVPPRPFDAWIFNADTCQWDPPFPSPADGNMYYWDGAINDWVMTEADND